MPAVDVAADVMAAKIFNQTIIFFQLDGIKHFIQTIEILQTTDGGPAREWRETGSVMRALASPHRTYKVVRISDADGTVQSIRHREISGAA